MIQTTKSMGLSPYRFPMRTDDLRPTPTVPVICWGIAHRRVQHLSHWAGAGGGTGGSSVDSLLVERGFRSPTSFPLGPRINELSMVRGVQQNFKLELYRGCNFFTTCTHRRDVCSPKRSAFAPHDLEVDYIPLETFGNITFPVLNDSALIHTGSAAVNGIIFDANASGSTIQFATQDILRATILSTGISLPTANLYGWRADTCFGSPSAGLINLGDCSSNSNTSGVLALSQVADTTCCHYIHGTIRCSGRIASWWQSLVVTAVGQSLAAPTMLQSMNLTFTSAGSFKQSWSPFRFMV